MVKRLLDWLFPPDAAHIERMRRLEAAIARDEELRNVAHELTVRLGRVPTPREMWAESPPPWMREEVQA